MAKIEINIVISIYVKIVELYRTLRCWLLVSGVTAGRQIYGPVLGSLTTSSWVVTSVLVLAPSSSWSTSPRHRYLLVLEKVPSEGS